MSREQVSEEQQAEIIREYCNHRWAIVDGKPMACLDCDEPARDVHFVVRAADLNEFWRGVYPNGMTLENIVNELQDFEVMIHNVPKVYCHVTGGLVSKHLTDAEVVISLHDEHVTKLVDEALAEERAIADE